MPERYALYGFTFGWLLGTVGKGADDSQLPHKLGPDTVILAVEQYYMFPVATLLHCWA
jgi:hypothetical protein